ncbi:sigma-70 family RNA polymerase sigma factor [Paenibacillus pasadenensis]|uniref:sigma-70 family RNA polymerase sigma factor n=1 Tax=Paenibacillus pasadenensis TaxID=217090 RepID=UPI00203EBD92|nr:sigma-70 family RNA polymerase sigma factor [Paenibacillus pasadenensis]MCM3748830.1 sigma-70 family RNA polymerase sigma factor [Paenibacillus pasadenensis]
MNQWIEGVKKGDQAASKQLVQHFSGMAQTVAYSKLGDAHLAEDAVQEAFAEAFKNLPKLQTAEAFPGWFKVIVERQCHRLLRRKQHKLIPIQEIEQVAEEKYRPEAIVEKREIEQTLHAFVADLSPAMRISVQLFYFQGYSLREISSFLDTPVSVLKKRLFDARLKLKKTLPVADLMFAVNQLYGGEEGMLHIVNGDHLADTLRQGVVEGEILAWREIYPVGPVFVDMDEKANRAARARYLEDALGIPQAEYLNSEKQEQILNNFNKHKEVILWFEHDLFDQTMLAYLLHFFSKQNLQDTQLSLLCIGEFPGIDLFRGLGQLTATQLKSLSGTWHTVGQRELETGRNMWEAYTSSIPDKHIQFLEEDLSALPFMRDAFEAHLSRMPSAFNGLGRIEQTTLEIAASGIQSPYELFQQVGNQLNVFGLGDLEFWYRLKKMATEPCSLLHIQGLEAFPDFKHEAPSFQNCIITLTELGREVLGGDKDWIALKEIDDWFGGIHLQDGKISWRWDTACNKLVQI